MIKLKDLLCICESNVHVMSGPVPILIISKSLDGFGYLDSEMLNTEVKKISSNDSYIKVWMKTKEGE